MREFNHEKVIKILKSYDKFNEYFVDLALLFSKMKTTIFSDYESNKTHCRYYKQSRKLQIVYSFIIIISEITLLINFLL